MNQINNMNEQPRLESQVGSRRFDMEKLDNIYGILQQWDHVINDAEHAGYVLCSLKQDNAGTSRLVDFFATADNTKVQEVLGLECLAKAGRNHLISFAEDRVTRARAMQRDLEARASAEYAPGRIKFLGQDNEFSRAIIGKIKSDYIRRIGRDTPKDDFVLEVPMSLPDLYDKLGNGIIQEGVRTWETALKNYNSYPLDFLSNLPESECRNLEKIHESYEKNVRAKGSRMSSALFRNDAEILGPMHHNSNFQGDYYAIRNESGKFETFYFTDSRKDLLVFVGTLLEKDVQNYLPDWKRVKSSKEAKE